mgnify:CR=1 FL=1
MNHFYLILLIISSTLAQIPTGYYDTAEGLSGEGLRLALHNIIDDHNVQSYSSLWTHFQSTDKKPNNKVWDMYSDVPGGTPPYEYTFGSDQCGNYGGESDCYNREHSWPKSWFNNASPMNSDLFHLYPTDGYVNGMRSNYPFGEVSDLKEWAVDMLLDWHEADPVSEKEIDRNNAVYDIQDNRNPFIDHPEWVDCIWVECGTGTQNTPPIADAGEDQTVVENATVYLDGTGSFDPESGELTYQWRPPNGIELDNETSPTPSFIATPVEDTITYLFSLTVSDGELSSQPDTAIITVNPLLGIEQNNFPSEYQLLSVFPNPFNPITTIQYSVEILCNASLQAFNINGQLVETLFDRRISPGTHQVLWDASHEPSGVYFIKFVTLNQTNINKIILLK